MKIIDLRSDTVTKPTPAMLEFMLRADVGDDVVGEDPTINRLEKMLAEQAGMEAAVYAPSGTQTNLMAIMAHCQRGDEYIVGQTAHTYMWEGGGGAVLGSVQPQPLDFETDGTLSLEKVARAIKPIDDHHPRSTLLCLENTTNGKVLPLEYLPQAKTFCQQHNLALHLDGARVFNAAVKLNVPLIDISRHFDSISICLSKGLGAPVGSVLCGSADLIKKARRWRKMLGGGMRQAGIIAAGGIYALEHNVARLQDDHVNAATLAKLLSEIDEIETDYHAVQTNIFFIRVKKDYPALQAFLESKGIILRKGANSAGMIRLVTHLDITKADILRVVEEIKNYYQS